MIETRDLCKRYGASVVVDRVSLRFDSGCVHSIVGENGAGKSTVVKMLAGAVPLSSGEIWIGGQRVDPTNPRRALDCGVAIVDQELALVGSRCVVDNVLLGVESSSAGVRGRKRDRARFDALLAEAGFSLAPDVLVRDLNLASRQKVEILRALARDARVVIMDEPTAALSPDEREQLYELVRRLSKRGRTIIWVSHFLDEVLRISDAVTVMRDGQHVATHDAHECTVHGLVEAMLGREPQEFTRRAAGRRSGSPVLRARAITTPGRFADISFDLYAGEILGVAGLVGSGRTEVLRGLCGAEPIQTGELELGGRVESVTSPRKARALGLVYLTEDRKGEGILPLRSIADNILLGSEKSTATRGVISRRRRRALAGSFSERLDVRARTGSVPVGRLSGGNQQKVLVARSLAANPRIFLVDEPTRGVDVGAKLEIYEILHSLALEGLAIVVVSSDLEELLLLSDRMLVMRRGRLARALGAEQIERESILRAAFGVDSAPDSAPRSA